MPSNPKRTVSPAALPDLGLLDGEIVALSGPRPDFTALQQRMRTGRPGAGLLAAVPVTLIVFDVLRSGPGHLVRSSQGSRAASGGQEPRSLCPWCGKHCHLTRAATLRRAPPAAS